MRHTSPVVTLRWKRADAQPVVLQFKNRNPFEIIERVEQELFQKGDGHGTPQRRS